VPLEDSYQSKHNGQPLVTVLMCAYNSEAHIVESIRSVLSQSYEDFRMLIVDDGSMDNTYAVAASFDDARLDIVRLPKNRGLTFALNFGLDRIATKYIARLDADDLLASWKLIPI
jgi:glycosyltransferase involved in cell wall biosynthesis